MTRRPKQKHDQSNPDWAFDEWAESGGHVHVQQPVDGCMLRLARESWHAALSWQREQDAIARRKLVDGFKGLTAKEFQVMINETAKEFAPSQAEPRPAPQTGICENSQGHYAAPPSQSKREKEDL